MKEEDAKWEKTVYIIVDNGCNRYFQAYDIEKVPLDELKELFASFVENKGIHQEC